MKSRKITPIPVLIASSNVVQEISNKRDSKRSKDDRREEPRPGSEKRGVGKRYGALHGRIVVGREERSWLRVVEKGCREVMEKSRSKNRRGAMGRAKEKNPRKILL